MSFNNKLWVDQTVDYQTVVYQTVQASEWAKAIMEYPQSAAVMLSLFPNIDEMYTFNTGDKRGMTEYIDYIGPKDFPESITMMRGIEGRSKRPFITLKTPEGIQTFFRRYNDTGMWACTDGPIAKNGNLVVHSNGKADLQDYLSI